MIQALEAATVARLLEVPALSAFQVEAWPEDAGHYTLRSRFGAVLVSYKGSTYTQPFPTDVVAQGRTLDFEVVVLCRNLRDHSGGYEALEAIRKAVQGWMPEGALRPAFITRDGFVGEEDGVWEFALYFSIPTIAVQDDPAPEEALGVLKTTEIYREDYP